MNINSQQELLKGTLFTIILKVLHDHDKMYGYELATKVKELTNNKILIKEGSLYPALHKLEANGLIVAEEVHIGKRLRKYYRLTKSGKNASEKAVNELVTFLETIHHLVTVDPHYGTA